MIRCSYNFIMAWHKKKPYELRNITRMDNPKFKGKIVRAWYVRFRQKGENVAEYFYDSKYESKEKSLEAAQIFRDDTEKRIALLPEIKVKPNRSNKSGIVGVYKSDAVTRKKSGKSYSYPHWFASWLEPSGKRRSKRFSISKHGEAAALRLALQARDEAVARITGIKRPPANWVDAPLSTLVERVETTTSNYEKGLVLEELTYRLFHNCLGFSVTDSRVQTETEEIDLIVLNNSTDPRFSRESAILLIECKNWSKKCGKNELVIFKEKVENRSSRCSIGFLISWNGFAQTFTKEMLRGSREQTLVIPIDGEAIKKAIREDSFEKAIIDAWHDAVTV